MLGKLLDRRYQVTQVLGAGGFGKTYLAQDTRRPGNPICVVKQLKPISNDTGFLETARRLFTSEGETLEQLGNHDQIPRLLAYFEEDNEFFLVQEFIEGHTLTEELLPGRRWEESRVIELLTEVLNILEFVHSQGVIHRDIKPDNLIRRNSDRKLVLVDFGAVKQMHTQLATTYAHSNTVAVGTPGYMSSEQARGQPRPNSDIYALGVIAIQALTGLAPMQMQDDQNTGEILWEHLVYVSRGLAAIVTKMVRYHFKDRYQSATEVLQELKQLSADYAAPTPQTLPVAPNRNLPSVERYPRPTEVIPQPRAVTPSSNSRQASIEPTANNSSGNAVPILIGLLLAGVAGLTAFAVQKGSFTSALRGDGNNQTIDVASRNCTVAARTLNVRSEPNGKVVNSVSKGNKLTLTGAERDGWVEINSPTEGWVYNDTPYIDCQPATPAIQAKATPKPVATPAKKPPKPTPVAVKPQPPQPSDAEKLAQAQEKYNNGDLQGAIAQAQVLIDSGSASAQEAKNKIIKWQKDWSDAKAKYDQVQKALDEGRWDEVIRAVDPQLLQQSYWRDKLSQLIAEANKQKAAAEAELKKSQSQPPESPQPEKSPAEPSKPKSSNALSDKVPATP
jgi:serine/threonine-protein kinase